MLASLVQDKKVKAQLDLKPRPPKNNEHLEGSIIYIAETQQGNLAILYEIDGGERHVFVHTASAINSTFTCLRTENGYKLCYGKSDYGGEIASLHNDPFASGQSF